MSTPADMDTVVALVQSTRDDLGARIDKLSERIDTVVTSHEHRLTVVETHQASQGERIGALEAKAAVTDTAVAAIVERQKADEAVTDALTSKRVASIAARHWMVGTLLSVLLVLVGLLAYLH